LQGEVKKREKPKRLLRALPRDVLDVKGLSIRMGGVII
jgi:hypothetical protein